MATGPRGIIFSGAAAGPAVVVECGRNGGRWRRRPLGWWRRPVGPGLWRERHSDIPSEAGGSWWLWIWWRKPPETEQVGRAEAQLRRRR
jgi:hypothetical protein